MFRFIAFLLIALTILSCTREADDQPATTFPYYFIATVDGRTIAYGADETDGGSHEAVLYQRLDPVADSFYVYEGATLVETGNPLSNNSITVALFKRFAQEPTGAQRIEMIDTLKYPAAFRDTTGIELDGAFVSYTDAMGKTWTSSARPQYDTILQVSSIRDYEGTAAAKVLQASFRCKLYSAAGDSILMENATIRARVFSR